MTRTRAPEVAEVLARLGWMRAERIWPNGRRYLWTDAFGLVLLVSLHEELGDARFLDEAQALVADVDRVLGRARGYRIGEAPERGGQYFHYLAMWAYALHVLGRHVPRHQDRAVALARAVHPCFVRPGVGVTWKMREDLSAPWPGHGLGGLDPYHGYVVWRALGERELAPEIAELAALVERGWRTLDCTQDLGLGMMLWFAHFHPEEPWARGLRARALRTLELLWIDPPGYFCRAPGADEVRFAFTNYGIAVGLQAAGVEAARVRALRRYFAGWRSHDEYDTDAITHVMACSAAFPGRWIARPLAP